MNEVELRIDKFIDLIELEGEKEFVNIKKCTITKFKEELLFGDSEILKSLKYTIEQMEDRCGRLCIYRFNVVDIKERESIYQNVKNVKKQEFFKKFNEEMYEGYLYFVEVAKSKKALMMVYADKSNNNAYNSDNINKDKFIVLM